MRYTKHQEQRIAECYNTTHTPKQLAKELGITVAQLMDKAHKMRRRDGKPVAKAAKPIGTERLVRSSGRAFFIRKTADGWKYSPKNKAA